MQRKISVACPAPGLEAERAGHSATERFPKIKDNAAYAQAFSVAFDPAISKRFEPEIRRGRRQRSVERDYRGPTGERLRDSDHPPSRHDVRAGYSARRGARPLIEIRSQFHRAIIVRIEKHEDACAIASLGCQADRVLQRIPPRELRPRAPVRSRNLHTPQA